jgi:hypothetical protein
LIRGDLARLCQSITQRMIVDCGLNGAVRMGQDLAFLGGLALMVLRPSFKMMRTASERDSMRLSKRKSSIALNRSSSRTSKILGLSVGMVDFLTWRL